MLPSEFVKRLQLLCPSWRLAAVTNSFAQPKHVAFRHNRLKVNNRGKISVLERVEGRFFRLNANLSPTDDANITSFIADEHEVGSLKPANFDKVLWNAPSSSQARLRSNDPASTGLCAKLANAPKSKKESKKESEKEKERVIDHLLQKRHRAT